MQSNLRLSIVVPTYNRAEYLDLFFKTHIPVVRKYNIQICISDNASTDHTSDVIRKWTKIYPHIKYSTQVETIHVDGNVQAALQLSETEYTWLMGDSYEIPALSLDILMSSLPDGDDYYDFIVLNLVGRLKEIEERIYTDHNEVLKDIGWMMTCISCSIYHKRSIQKLAFGKYKETEFGHLGMILDYLSSEKFKLLWAQKVAVVTLKTPVRKAGWGPYFLSNIFVKWPQLIDCLPDSYTAESKKKLLRSFPVKAKLLGWRNILAVRSQGVLNREQYDQYKNCFDRVAPSYFRYYAFSLTYIPQDICRLAVLIIEWCRRKSFQLKKRIHPDSII